MGLENFTDGQLKAELERREKEAAKKGIPEQVANPSLDRLRAICRDYIKALAVQGWADDDYKHYIYETALEVLYGRDIWQRIRELVKKSEQ